MSSSFHVRARGRIGLLCIGTLFSVSASASERPPFAEGLLNAPDNFRPRPRKKKVRKHARKTRLAPRSIVRRAAGLRGKRFKGASYVRAERRMLRSIYRRALDLQRLDLVQKASPGDLVVFHNAVQRGGHDSVSRAGAKFGVVTSVRGSRVRFVYISGRRARMGVLHRGKGHLRRSNRGIENSYVRTKRRHDPAGTAYLAGELLAGFARPLDA